MLGAVVRPGALFSCIIIQAMDKKVLTLEPYNKRWILSKNCSRRLEEVAVNAARLIMQSK